MSRPGTVGELRESGYRVVGVKEEIRHNVLRKLRQGEPLFPGILGYDETVIPEIIHALLAQHDFLLLGLRGQAKTRLLRSLVQFLDDAIPVLADSELNENPFAPLTRSARERLAEQGDRTPIAWIGRDERYHEKLATPDVTVADLLGDIDLIKHAEGRHLTDEGVLHFGLIPRSHRGIFCLNELPDLTPKVQVALFNVLEERDIQVRGFPIRLTLDLCMVFSANPEDYTSRGRIVSPLKDRIGSVVRTHYPRTRELGIAITRSNARLVRAEGSVFLPPFLLEIVEEMVRLAREHPSVNQHSGVSVRLAVDSAELLASAAERRGWMQGETVLVPRIGDLRWILAAGRGKVEVSLDEPEGQEDRLLERLLSQAIGSIFQETFPQQSFASLLAWFQSGQTWTVGEDVPPARYAEQAAAIPGLTDIFDQYLCGLEQVPTDPSWRAPLLASLIELMLEGLCVTGKLAKKTVFRSRLFRLGEKE